MGFQFFQGRIVGQVTFEVFGAAESVQISKYEPWLIDFQGGRKGPVYYDVASFLWQAKANYPDSLRQELLKEYECRYFTRMERAV